MPGTGFMMHADETIASMQKCIDLFQKQYFGLSHIDKCIASLKEVLHNLELVSEFCHSCPPLKDV